MKNNLVEFVDVMGSISYFCRGTGISQEDLCDIDIFNIRDEKRNIIGSIDSFDFENDIWYGRILKSSSVYENIVNDVTSSMVLVGKRSKG